MSSAIDDDDLSLSISSPPARGNSGEPKRRDADVGSASSTGPVRSGTQLPTAMKRRLGQYEIVKTLGEGSFGKVKLATHKVSGQKVALKIISRGKLITRDMAGRIEREIQYLQLLRHPHIIKLFTVITTPKEIVMVLEYAGGELFDYIVNHGRLHEDKARKFFQQIVCAIEYCHRHKIVHRDLKPENLLLDDSFNVKIADFGLSNIMTDGNFLKTSCGSPNYAAPEVISGKLYAGPEVDVWSCGVILYVLLTGRLPFDDEYIPALFKKIQQGNYTVPNYISPAASKLIKRMLQVNPVSRITIQEIRLDPWFTKDLAEYLQPPVEEFLDTGVDPNKAIDPRKLAPNKPALVQEQLHDTVVGKLGKTMGYAKDDVQDALAKEEPSAIKDAYLIVRENTIMKANPSVNQNPDLQRFLAQSPPAYGSPRFDFQRARPNSSPLSKSTGLDAPRQSSGAIKTVDMRSPTSTIAVLPSSLPSFHTAFMQGHRPAAEQDLSGDAEPAEPQTADQKAATARRLNPHARVSQVNLARMEKPEGMTPLPKSAPKKPKPTKWQFGIRSRNSPSEAMLAIYKALANMGAVWETPKIRKPGRGREGSRDRREGREKTRETRQREASQSPEYSDSDPEAGTDPEYATAEEREARRRKRAKESGSASDSDVDGGELSRHPKHRLQARGRDRYGPWNDWGYSLPEDPWIINARFRKDDLLHPGAAHPSSTHSSRVDLTDSSSLRRAASTAESPNEAAPGSAHRTPPMDNSPFASSEDVVHGTASDRGSSSRNTPPGRDTESCWVYVTIQLYCIEQDSYMVDFKCAGYERTVDQLRDRIRSSLSIEQGAATDMAGMSDDEVEDGADTLTHNAAGPGATGAGSDAKNAQRSAARKAKGPDEGFVGQGRAVDEKDISSPFPFMDVASSLIVSLAQRE